MLIQSVKLQDVRKFAGLILLAIAVLLVAACSDSNSHPTYTVGGTVSGLAGSGLVLQDNNGDDLSITADGTFTFAIPVASGAAYAVTVKTQPRLLAQICSVTSGSGLVADGPVHGVQVTCVTPTPRFAYVTQALLNTVTAYAIDSTNGELLSPPIGTKAAGNGPISIAIDPSMHFVYVANVNSNDVSAYRADATTGTLTAVAGSPFKAGTNPYQVTVDPAGHFLYVANASSSDISAYAIDSNTGALSEVNGSPFAAGNGSRSFQLAPSGRFGYGTSPTAILVYMVDPTTGALSQVDSLAPKSDSGGINVNIDPAGRFLYAPNYQWATPTYVTGCSLDGVTGGLTEVPNSPFLADGGASWAVVEPAGRYAYVANLASSTVVAYSIDQATGALTRIGSYAAGATATDFVIADPSGRFVYAGNDHGTISGFTINPSSGALAPMSTFPFNLPSQGGGYGTVAMAILSQ